MVGGEGVGALSIRGLTVETLIITYFNFEFELTVLKKLSFIFLRHLGNMLHCH